MSTSLVAGAIITAPAFAAIVLASIIVYYFLIHPLYVSPLAKIPNAHWTSAISPVWILWKRYSGRELLDVNEAHRKLGPIVRLGPKDLSVSCYENGIRTIYGGGFDKPKYYDFFSYYGKPNAFCSRTRRDHTFHRKRMSAAYTRSALYSSPQLAVLTGKILYNRLLPRLQANASASQPAEVLELSYALCLDLVNCFIFGYSSGPNFLQQPVATRNFLEAYEDRYCKEAFWPQELPRTTQFLNMIGIDMLPKQNEISTQYLEQWMINLCDNSDVACAAHENGMLEDEGDIPVVYQQVKKAVEADSKQADASTQRLEVASELFDHMSGAREVLGLVLAYTIYYISQHPLAQDRLRAELTSLTPSMNVPPPTSKSTFTPQEHAPLPSPASLDNLPYLTAVLKESFRMRPTSTPLPRITPSDRAVSIAGIEGVPPGTRVNSFQWFVHRDPEKWAHVDEWMPERWLDKDGKLGPESVLWAFGSGPRTCVGSNYTQYTMRYILALIYSNFTSRVVDDGTYARHPPGSLEDKLMVQFEHISASPLSQ